MSKLKKSQFRFRENDNVGAEGAELDAGYLQDCYYDRGDLLAIRDCTNPSCIVLGRTGSGKTALLFKFKEDEEHVFDLKPESLSSRRLHSRRGRPFRLPITIL
jgi:hypothetical protein